MKKVPLWYPLVLAIVFAIYGPIFTPSLRLAVFAPLLALSFYRLCFVKSLWLSFLCGLVIDTVSSQMHYGLYGITYCITSAICYMQKKHFFEDKPTALSLFTYVIAAVFSLSLLIVSMFFDKQVHMSSKAIISDVLIAPIFDAVYAFVWFTLPIKLYTFVSTGAWKKYLKKNEPEESEQ